MFSGSKLRGSSCHREPAGERRSRGHVSQAEREEGRAAHVQVYAESRAAVRTCHLRSDTPMEKREGDDQAECPESDQQDQRERAEYRENVFPSVALGESLRGRSPWRPQEPVEGPRRPEPSRDAAGEDDRLECIPENDEDEESGDGSGPWMHGPDQTSLYIVSAPPRRLPRCLSGTMRQHPTRAVGSMELRSERAGRCRPIGTPRSGAIPRVLPRGGSLERCSPSSAPRAMDSSGTAGYIG